MNTVVTSVVVDSTRWVSVIAKKELELIHRIITVCGLEKEVAKVIYSLSTFHTEYVKS